MNVTRNRLGRFVTLLGLLLLVAASPAIAQGFKWWHNDDFRRELGLTPEQSARLEEIFQASQPALRSQKKALDHAEDALERLLETGEEASVMAQVTTVESARAELSKSRTLMLLRMRRVLTTDQRVKLTALHQAWDRDRKGSLGHRRPGSAR